MDSYTRQIK